MTFGIEAECAIQRSKSIFPFLTSSNISSSPTRAAPASFACFAAGESGGQITATLISVLTACGNRI